MWAAGPSLQAGSTEKTDPYADYVTLLLDFAGTSGSTNFVDLSAHQHVVASLGNAALSSTHYVSPSTSVYFDGTGDALTIPSNAAFDFNSGDWTVELWFRCAALPVDYRSLFIRRAGTGVTPLGIGLKAGGTVSIACSADGSTWAVDYQSPTGTVKINTWHHLAVVRSGTTIRVFFDGVALYQKSGVTPMASSSAIGIGADADGSVGFNGYIDLVRVTKGIARYGLPSITTTVTSANAGDAAALNFSGGSLVDYVGNSWSAAGNASYSTSQRRYGTHSLYLDGNGDYVYYNSGSANAALGAGDYTVDLWMYPTTLSKANALIGQSTNGFSLQVTSGNVLEVAQSYVAARLTGTATVVVNKWQHVAVVRQSGVLYLYLDGVLCGSVSNNDNLTAVDMYVGGYPGIQAQNTFAGYVACVRVTKGAAVFPPSSFVPVTAFVAPIDKYRRRDIALLQFNSDASTTSVWDIQGRKWTVQDNAALSTTQSMFGGGSIYFDGTNDYLSFRSAPEFDLGDTWSVDFWVRPNATNVNFGLVGRGNYEANTNWTGLTFSIRWLSTNVLRVYFYATSQANEQYIDITGALSANTWSHIAVTREGTTGHVFVNGVLKGIRTGLTTPASSSQPLTVGYWSNYNGAEKLAGYIDSLRITKGTVRPFLLRTSSPGSAFTTDAFTEVLMHFDGDFVDATGYRTWTGSGGIATSASQTKFGSQSCYVDGNAKYLNTNTNAGLSFGNEDFTVEFWAYPTSNSNEHQMFIDFRPPSTNGAYLMVGIYYAASYTSWAWHTSDVFTCLVPGSVKYNEWQHVAFTRADGRRYIHVNGVMIANEADTVNYVCGSGRPTLFSNGWANGNNAPRGYIDEVRISRGIARYSARSFTPPSAPFLRSDPDFKKLVSFIPGRGPNAGTAVYDVKGLPWTGSGVVTSTVQSRFGGSSLNFNGSAYLDTTNTAVNLGTASFAWKAWVYSSTTGGWSRLVETSEYNSATAGWHMSFNGSDAGGARRLGMQLSKSGGGGDRLESDAAFPNASWTYVEVGRTKGTGYSIINGVLQADLLPLGATRENWATQGIRLGSTKGTPSNYFLGYMSDIAVSSESRFHWHNTIPPIEAPTNVTNTASVLNFEGDLTDATGKSWSPSGDAATSAATCKFGTRSLYLDGSGDYISTTTHADFGFGTGDFTVEAWVKTSRKDGVVLDTRSASHPGVFAVGSGSVGVTQIAYYDPTAGSKVGITDICDDSWHHCVWCRHSGVMYMLVDGNLEARWASTVDFGASRPARIGADYTGAGLFLGYIDGFRVVNGESIYRPSLAPTSSPISDVGTVSLLHMEGPDNSTTVTDEKGLSWSTSGNTKISTNFARFGGSSLYVGNGSITDGLSCSSADLNLLSGGDWSIDCWIYPTVAATHGVWSRDGSISGMLLRTTASLSGFQFVYPGLQQSADLGYQFRVNTWTHVLVCRIGTQHYFFQNGRGGAFTISNRTADASGSFIVGRSSNPGAEIPFRGYIDAFRVNRGTIPHYLPPQLPQPHAFAKV